MTPVSAHDCASGSARSENASSDSRRGRALIEREELRSERRRVCTALGVGIVGWNVFGAVDVVRFFAGLDETLFPIALRFAVALPVIPVYSWLRAHDDVSPRVVRVIEVGTFVVAGAGLGLLAVFDTGIDSFHVHGLTIVVLGHGLLLGSTWRRALLPLSSVLLASLAILALGALVDSELAAQWTRVRSVGEFAQSFTLALGALVLALIGGHAVAKLRHEALRSKSIGRYELKAKIGSGGMGEVWCAYHRGLKRDVAVKLIQPALGPSDVAARRFEREVRALAELQHPHVVRVLDYGTTEDGIWYYAMELLDGEDLGTIVQREGPMRYDRATSVVRQAAEALAEAHARGIVHRDVKPANLLLVRTPGGGEFVKLIDFGIAKVADEGGELTMSGMVLGTPGYMAPEVITGGDATPRSDVYALGAVLYYLLAGRAALDATTPRALVVAHVAEEPPSPSARLGRPLPSALEAIVMRCLRKDASARFAHAGELAAALAALPPAA